jgi:two-component system, NtrC family, response regulator
LRDRKKDIPILAKYFLKRFSYATNNRIKSMSEEFIEHLQNHDWKGNVRELKNIIERACILEASNQLTADSLPLELQTGSPLTPNYKSFDLAMAERLHIQKVLSHTRGNKAEAARLLNIGLTTLYRKLDEYSIPK